MSSFIYVIMRCIYVYSVLCMLTHIYALLGLSMEKFCGSCRGEGGSHELYGRSFSRHHSASVPLYSIASFLPRHERLECADGARAHHDGNLDCPK